LHTASTRPEKPRIDPKEQKRKKNSVVRVKVRREACTDTKKQKGERKTKLTSIYTEPN